MGEDPLTWDDWSAGLFAVSWGRSAFVVSWRKSAFAIWGKFVDAGRESVGTSTMGGGGFAEAERESEGRSWRPGGDPSTQDGSPQGCSWWAVGDPVTWDETPRKRSQQPGGMSLMIDKCLDPSMEPGGSQTAEKMGVRRGRMIGWSSGRWMRDGGVEQWSQGGWWGARKRAVG